MYGSSFDTICVIIVYCKDIYGRYCIKRSKMITSTRGDGTLVFHLFAPEKPRDIAFYPIRP